MDNNNLYINENLLLNTFITMYNDNIRQIQNLTVANNEIRTTIIDTLHIIRNNRIDDRQNTLRINTTIEQIEIATRTVSYSDIEEPVNSSCPISLDIFNKNDNVTLIKQCGHIFNSELLNTWFQNNCACPICRYDIRSYIDNNV